jgi:hypothetical protein
MKARIKRVFGKGRYANVTATMALIVALGGTSYAAITLPANSVGSRQIKRGGVRNSDIGRSAVTSGKVRNGTLRTEDFRAGQLPAGAQGPQGATGATGARGPSDGFSFHSGNDILNFIVGTRQTVASLRLPAGKFVITAKVIANSNDARDATYDCELLAGRTVIDSTFDSSGLDIQTNDNADRSLAAFAGTTTLAAAGSVDLVCRTTATSGNWLARTITAVQVATLNGA